MAPKQKNKKTIEVDERTWKALNTLKTAWDKKSIDEVILNLIAKAGYDIDKIFDVDNLFKKEIPEI